MPILSRRIHAEIPVTATPIASLAAVLVMFASIVACDPEQLDADGDDKSSAAGNDSGTASGEDESTADAHHPACDSPFDDPKLPRVNTGPDGVPRFDQWRGLDCTAAKLKYPACGGPNDPSCGQGACLRFGGERGVCTLADIDIWCDGEGEVISYGDFACWMCSPLEVHAAACCRGLAGFDCRQWPFPADGPPGAPCAVHDDCEAGLVCGSHAGEGYGVCMCPEANGTDVAPEADCIEWS